MTKQKSNPTAPAAEIEKNPVAVEKIGKIQVAAAQAILEKYKDGKRNLDARIVENEQWFKIRHWEAQQKFAHPSDKQLSHSAWLFNSIANKHADAMDNYPEVSVLPREESDIPASEILSGILPVVFEQNDYERVYNDKWWYKLKVGTAAEGIFWNKNKNNGLGDIDIRLVDILNLFWEPGIKDIQDSRNVFHVTLVDNDLLEQQYPFLKGKLGNSAAADVAKYVYDDMVDTWDKSVVVDWYYKVRGEGGAILHYCKFCNGEVLWASENAEEYRETGWYSHGKYPFVFDRLFPVEGAPVGFGYIDIMKDPQMYIDRMQTSILENAVITSKKRYFIRNDGNVNEKEYADLGNDFIHVNGNLDDMSIREIVSSPVPGVCVTVLNNKIEELKETSGNRDVSQGGTTGGVTAASAIAALQEAGSKQSRDMLKSSYRSFKELNEMAIELMRQFYDEPRFFRIRGGSGNEQYVAYDNGEIRGENQGTEYGVELGERRPIFDLKIRAQKAGAYSKLAQNELALQFFGAGFFNPQLTDQALACVEMMDFDGKDQIIKKITENGTMAQVIQQQQEQLAQMAQMIQQAQQPQPSPQMGAAAPISPMGNPGIPEQMTQEEPPVGGKEISFPGAVTESAVTAKARQRTAMATDPT